MGCGAQETLVSPPALEALVATGTVLQAAAISPVPFPGVLPRTLGGCISFCPKPCGAPALKSPSALPLKPLAASSSNTARYFNCQLTSEPQNAPWSCQLAFSAVTGGQRCGFLKKNGFLCTGRKSELALLPLLPPQSWKVDFLPPSLQQTVPLPLDPPGANPFSQQGCRKLPLAPPKH